MKELALKYKTERDTAEKAVDVYEDRICRIVEYKQNKSDLKNQQGQSTIFRLSLKDLKIIVSFISLEEGIRLASSNKAD